MRTIHDFHLKDVAHWAHVPDDAPGRTALITAGVMAALAVMAFLAGVMNLAAWPPVLGALFLGSGIAELIDSATARETRRGLRIGVAGALPALLGLFLIFQLGHGERVIAVAIGIYFVVDGLARAAVGLLDRYWRWGWDEVYALVAAALGTAILVTGGAIALSRLWFFVAAELVFRALSVALRDYGLHDELTHPR